MGETLKDGYTRRADGRLQLRFRYNGERFSVYGRTYQECEEKKNKKLIAASTGTVKRKKTRVVVTKESTINEVYEAWQKGRKGTIQESTKYTNDRRWKNIIDFMGDIPISKVTEDKILNAREKMLKSETLSTSSINDDMDLLGAVIKYAMHLDLIKKNPCEGVPHLKRVEPEATDTNHRALTLDEQKLFFKYAESSWYYDYFAFLIRTGLRCGEASALTWDDVDLKKGVMHVTRTWSRKGHSEWILRTGLKTKAGKRDIPINDDIREVLERQIDRNSLLEIKDDLNLVFRNTEGNWVQRNTTNLTIKHILWKIAEEEEVIIPIFSNHAFRATFATRAIENGMEPHVLKTILGHSKIAITLDLYAHVLPDVKVDAMNKLSIAV